MSGINWNEIKESVVAKQKSKTDITFTIRDAAKVIMADGKEYAVNDIRTWVEAGLNAEAVKANPDAEHITVNWSTVKYALKATPGMKETGKNTFKYAPVKAVTPKK